ncbi:unnamed protein product [Cuscuta epithymum]|uniref:Myb-like domain-containing protein n=1 Tax=Cuscuta epithymum TaxID=186058 RepID=A0AAV0DSE3_9ASTE|nr:unnamed protein product [Cuscuta epithymum]
MPIFVYKEWITKSLNCGSVPSASTLPWIWVVEALASSKQIDASLLIDLVKRIPETSDDFERSAKKMLSLRILQNLFIKRNGNLDGTSLAAGSKMRLGLSERCEDRLCKLLQEISASSLKMSETEILNMESSTLPQSFLLQLKDMFVKGSDPHLAPLKQRSGLPITNQSGNATSVDVSAFNGIGETCEERNFEHRAENGNLVASTHDNENNLKETLHDRDPLAKKRKCVSAGNQGKVSPEERIVLDDYSGGPGASKVTKKCKLSAAFDKNCVHITECTEKEGCNLENESQARSLEESGSHAVKGSVHATKCIGKEGANFRNKSQARGLEERGSGVQLCNSNDARQPLPQQLSHANGTKRNFQHDLSNGGHTHTIRGKVDSSHELQSCSDSDEYHEEMIEITSKKTVFLNSQGTYSQDSLETTGLKELNLCVKCNGGGQSTQLLVCNSETCPLVIHSSCLGSIPSFEKDGRFYCPFCAYSRAISQYMGVKKKASLARKDLASFIGVQIEQPQNNFSTRSSRSKTSQPRQDAEQCEKDEANISRFFLKDTSLPQCSANTEEKQQEQHSVSSDGDGSPSKNKRISSTNAIVVYVEKGPLYPNEDDDQSHNETPAITIKNMQGMPHGDPERVTRMNLQPELTSRTDLEESSEEEKGKSQASGYRIRFRKPEKKRSFPEITQWRRKNIPWTKEEEEALKDAVEKYKTTKNRNMPWKEILELGADHFWKGRTAVDLKDKWRNICKGSSSNVKGI